MITFNAVMGQNVPVAVIDRAPRITFVKSEAQRVYVVWEEGNPIPIGMIRFYLAGKFAHNQFNFVARTLSPFVEKQFTSLDKAKAFFIGEGL
jgi:hypothetical protein